jgi:hypothetical protein
MAMKPRKRVAGGSEYAVGILVLDVERVGTGIDPERTSAIVEGIVAACRTIKDVYVVSIEVAVDVVRIRAHYTDFYAGGYTSSPAEAEAEERKLLCEAKELFQAVVDVWQHSEPLREIVLREAALTCCRVASLNGGDGYGTGDGASPHPGWVAAMDCAQRLEERCEDLRTARETKTEGRAALSSYIEGQVARSLRGFVGSSAPEARAEIVREIEKFLDDLKIAAGIAIPISFSIKVEGKPAGENPGSRPPASRLLGETDYEYKIRLAGLR